MDAANDHAIPTINSPIARPVHPLGPIIRFERFIHPRLGRTIAAVICFATVTPLVIAAQLTPDPAGVGTHEQLGFPSCGLFLATGVPCPTCGMTTAFAHAVRGQWIAAIIAQPAGAALAFAAMLTTLAAAISLATGRGWRLNIYRVSTRKLVIAAVAFAILAWGYKILTASTTHA
jgi:hypothetical protein